MTEERSKMVVRLYEDIMMSDHLHKRIMNKRLSDSSVRRSRHTMIMYLFRRKRRPVQREIAEELELTPAAVTIILDGLAQDGLIVRTVPVHDKRAFEIGLSDAGRQKAEEIMADLDILCEKMCAGISDKELRITLECMEMIRENLLNLQERSRLNQEGLY